MSCDECEALRARVAELEARLGLVRDIHRAEICGGFLGISATQARVVLAIYDGRGLTVIPETIAERAGVMPSAIKTWVHGIRQVLGDDFVQNLRGAGYRLPIPALSRVMAALERVEFQETRG